MAWSITAAVHSGPDDLAGAVDLTVVGDPDAAIEVWRNDPNGEHPVRNIDPLPSSGAGQYIDVEAPLGVPVTYTVRQGGRVRARSNEVTAPPLASGYALLRSVLRPYVQAVEVAFVDEVGTEWPTSSTAFAVVGSYDPVVVGDTRRRRRGTFVFAPASPGEASDLVYMLRDGIPFLLRLCPNGQRVQRDTLFYALNVTEARWGYSGRRELIVDFQSVDWVAGDTDVPEPGTWTYEDLRSQTSAPAYDYLPVQRDDYLALLLDPVTP